MVTKMTKSCWYSETSLTKHGYCYCSVLLVVCVLCAPPVVHTQKQLTLAVFISGITNGTGQFTGNLDGRIFKSAVELAVDIINQNSTGLLEGYQLNHVFNDSRCEAGPSVRGFIDQIFIEPTKIMIIGADCSIATEPIAELAPFWNLVQISPLSSSPSLSGLDRFLRVVSSDVEAANGIVSLMLQFNWTRLAVISQQESIFTSTFAALRLRLQQVNITDEPRDFSFNTNENPQDHVIRLNNSPTRIIFLNVYPAYAIEIMCQAYQLGMTHEEGYQWLIYAWYPSEWWKAKPADRDGQYTPILCNADVLEEMIEHTFIVDHYPFVNEEDRSKPTDINDMSRATFDSLLTDYLNDQFTDVDMALFDQAQFYFDAVWTAALALDATIREGFDLSSFTYDPEHQYSVNISETIFSTTKKLNFTGMSGPLSFDSNNSRLPDLRYLQYQRRSGTIDKVILGRDLKMISEADVFPFGVPVDEQYDFIDHGLFIVYAILACLGIVFALVCLVFNLIFRERKVVKLSSPSLNLLIILGAVLFYVDVILFGIDEGTPASRCTVNALCMTRLWIASIAFTLMFGTIFIKTWRVYYIFYSTNRHKKDKKFMIQDWVLFSIIGVIIIMDVVFLIIVTSIPSTRLQLENQELPSNDRELPSIIGLCQSRHRIIWLSILLAYKGLLLVVGVFLAFETRKVKIRELNDSKLIGMSVYCIVILSLALTALSLLLETYIDILYGVVGLMVLLGNTFLLCLIFLPKLYGLWKDPEGLRVMTSTQKPSEEWDSTASKETITQLSQEVQRLKKELHKINTTSSLTPIVEVEAESASNHVAIHDNGERNSTIFEVTYTQRKVEENGTNPPEVTVEVDGQHA